MATSSLVYFIQSGDNVKIGITRNVAKRVASLQTGSAMPLVVLNTMPGGEKTESILHAALAAYRQSGEWFKLCDEVRKCVADPAGFLAEQKARRNHVSAFLLATLRPDPEGSASLRRLHGRYREWCAERALPALPPAELGQQLRVIVDAIGLEVEPEGKDMVVRGAALAA